MENDKELPEGDHNGENGDGNGKDLPERIPPEEFEGEEIEDLTSAISKLAKGKPGTVSEFMTMVASGPMMSPLIAKMKDGHITSMLKIVSEHDEREYNLRMKREETDSTQRRQDRWLVFGAFLIVILLTGFVLVLFKDKPDVLIPSLTGLGGIIAGFLGGFGMGRRVD